MVKKPQLIMPTTDELKILELCDQAAVFQNQGNPADAIRCYRRATELKSDIPQLHKNLGDAYRDIGDVKSAISAYKHAIKHDPEYASALNNLGLIYHKTGNYSEAVLCYKAAMRSRPDLTGTLRNLRNSSQRLNQIDDAIAVHIECLKVIPSSARVYSSLGICYALSNDLKRAEAAFVAAIALNPEFSEAHEGLADVLSVIGQIDRANDHYRRCIELVPFTAHLFYKLAFHGGFRTEDPLLSILEHQASDISQLDIADQILVHFALSKALEDVQRYDESFHQLRLGTVLKRSTMLYDEAGEIARVRRLQTTFSAGLINSKRGFGHPSTQPVFVVGMPRSGSTLLERVLAGHPDIATVGESNQFALAVAKRRDVDYRNLANMDRECLRELGNDYLTRIRALAPPKTYIIDKTLSNFASIGLIHLVFPSARVVHIVRNPLDVCFSCFATLFDAGHSYSYDLREVGRYYQLYAGAMAYWKTVVANDSIIDVVYEDLVRDLRSTTNAVLEQLGLNWSDGCLYFYKDQRPVHTASLVQVRKPVYNHSIGRWARYGNMLAPLQEELRACE